MEMYEILNSLLLFPGQKLDQDTIQMLLSWVRDTPLPRLWTVESSMEWPHRRC